MGPYGVCVCALTCLGILRQASAAMGTWAKAASNSTQLLARGSGAEGEEGFGHVHSQQRLVLWCPWPKEHGPMGPYGGALICWNLRHASAAMGSLAKAASKSTQPLARGPKGPWVKKASGTSIPSKGVCLGVSGPRSCAPWAHRVCVCVMGWGGRGMGVP